ncbi:MAG: hypothetical protein R3B68_05340 [Phycisphaerales bacterium]
MLRVLLILMAIVGLIALIRGFVGRRVGTGPHCRCGYDLEGLAERTTCPECGAAVWDPVNVRLGARRRGPRMMIVGALLLVLGGAGFGTLRALVPPGANPYAWQPDWLLVMQGPGESDGGRLFTDEVISRLQNGGFSPSQRTALASGTGACPTSRHRLDRGPVAARRRLGSNPCRIVGQG